MTNIKQNIKSWVIFWLSAWLTLLLVWFSYAAITGLTADKSSWDSLLSSEWNQLVNNQNDLQTQINNIPEWPQGATGATGPQWDAWPQWIQWIQWSTWPQWATGSMVWYTTSEVDTWMTWIDGKPIYKKTVTSCGAMPNAAVKYCAHGISNFDKLVRADLIEYRSSDNTYHTNSNDTQAGTYGTTNIKLYSTYDRTAFDATVTLFYTKTTD